ncbi:Hypothetical protein, putative [Bodo saltans]|uniref:Uncharacterized protein n=1 Tax=Bodo saltans TaxID=75058 RepID=A0A0S4IYG2_BODSA|nr:Hypothetical protein, putative [Bodo saltans]|eukprot:CUG55190.1 Hypothetical protein, putative [Bodo saltans]
MTENTHEVSIDVRSTQPPAIALTAMNSTIAASMDTALRGEIKRLREEVSDLRREASRGDALRSEVAMLRSVTLMQAEEKVPLRLRELEAENQRLKRANRSLEEKLISIEGDSKYRDLLNSWTSSEIGFANRSNPVQAEMERSLHLEDEVFPTFTNGSMLSHPLNGSVVGNRVLVLKPQSNPCLTCGTRLVAAETAFDTEKKKLHTTIKSLEQRLAAANDEIRAVQAWIAPLVTSIQQYPRSADLQPLQQLHNFASPTRTTAEAQHYGRQMLGSSLGLHSR